MARDVNDIVAEIYAAARVAPENPPEIRAIAEALLGVAAVRVDHAARATRVVMNPSGWVIYIPGRVGHPAYWTALGIATWWNRMHTGRLGARGRRELALALVAPGARLRAMIETYTVDQIATMFGVSEDLLRERLRFTCPPERSGVFNILDFDSRAPKRGGAR